MKKENPLLLIVDDSRMSRMLIRALIADKRPHWQIQEAASGEEALQLATDTPPDFVSMDVNMPGMNGIEAAGRLRMRLPEARITLCTANIQESTRDAASRAGISFIAKPITAKSMDEAIAFYEGDRQ
jgi:CheY-like chemotaxis protein